MLVLSGDIGGTKTNLGLFDVKNQQLNSLFEASYLSCEYQSLEAVISQFLTQLEMHIKQPVSSACFGIAGPVYNNRCEVTNLPWLIDATQLQSQFAWQSVSLLNDLEANAWGLSALNAHDFVNLNQGCSGSAEHFSSNASIIAAGTGLGEAGMFWDGERHIPFATEGGHCDFSPGTEQEYRLHQYLSKKYCGHVSWERIVSGMGLINLYQFLCYDTGGKTPGWLQEQMQEGDAAAAISNAALADKDKLCLQALDWFIHLYGVEAGNHALKIMSRGGVFLGGGIAPKIIDRMQAGGFMKSFCDKGRMQSLLEAMPVKVIMNEKTALYGPAIYAASHLKM